MTWKHYPDSPFGDVELCAHGCDRPPGSKEPVCIECDYPPEAIREVLKCNTCKAGKWHIDGKCLGCGNIPAVKVSIL